MNKKLETSFKIAQSFIDADKNTSSIKPIAPEANSDLFELEINAEGIGDDQFAHLMERIVMHTPQTASKTFFNQLFGGRNMPALTAEILSAVTNNSMYTYKVAGVQVAIEKEVLNTMLKYIGFAEGDGGFMPGGSISNMTAMMVARNEKVADIVNTGKSQQTLVAYTSEQSHYSIEKNAAILGLGRDHVRKIASDAQGKMDVVALAKAIQEDIEKGQLPFFINATAGTTVLGAFDPFEAIKKIARQYNIWMHIDAAWGGGVFLSEKHKHLLNGADQADSITWNAHKMMNVPLVASALLMKKKGLLHKHYSLKNDYLYQTDEDQWNPGLSSLQCGRRNDAFKIWAAWKYYGKEGYAKRTEKQFALAQYAANQIKKDPQFHLVIEPESLNVCFTVDGISAIALCNGLYEEGLIQVGYGRWNETVFVRLILVNPDMETSDIDAFFNTIKEYMKTA